MSALYSYFLAYLKFGLPKIKWVFLFGFLFGGILCVLYKKGYVKQYKNTFVLNVCGGFLSWFCSFIFVMTLFGRTRSENENIKMGLLESYVVVFAEQNIELLLQIIMNIIMYIPLGFLLPCYFRIHEKYGCVCVTTIICSFGIELIQLILKIGMFEIDDVINNVLGATIGYLFWVLFSKVKRKNEAKNIEK